MRSYYEIFDVKEFYESSKHSYFVCIEDGDNILHEAFKHAQQNKHEIGDMRIVRYETKKAWEERYNQWTSQIKFK